MTGIGRLLFHSGLRGSLWLGAAMLVAAAAAAQSILVDKPIYGGNETILLGLKHSLIRLAYYTASSTHKYALDLAASCSSGQQHTGGPK